MTSVIMPRPVSTRCWKRSGSRGPIAVPITVPVSTVPTLMKVPTTPAGRMAGDARRRCPARFLGEHRRAAVGRRRAGGLAAPRGGVGRGGGGPARARVADDGGDRAGVGAVGSAGGGGRRLRAGR